MITSEHIAAAGTDSNTKFKLLDDLAEDLLKAPSNFKTVMEFHNKDFNVDKPPQYEEARKEIIKMNGRHVEDFGPVSLLFFPSDRDDDDEEIRLLITLMFHPHVFLYSFFFLCFNFLNRMFG